MKHQKLHQCLIYLSRPIQRNIIQFEYRYKHLLIIKMSLKYTFLALSLTTALLILYNGGQSLITGHQNKNNADYISDYDYDQWKHDFGVSYPPHQDSYRRHIFANNLFTIAQHNQKRGRYMLGVNQFMAMTKQEWMHTYLQTQAMPKLGEPSLRENTVPANLEVDWARQGVIMPVQNSGSMCAASYATSAVGALESLRKIKYGLLKKLSKQEIIDCSEKFGNFGCNSGTPTNSFKYVAAKGISDDSQYPYSGAAKACQTQYATFKITGYVQLKNCQDLQNQLMRQPISVLVDASNWMFYKSGIFNQCSGTTLNLAVLLTAMTEKLNYWQMKNQWGTSWGQSGYIRIQMGNCCGICTMASAPLE